MTIVVKNRRLDVLTGPKAVQRLSRRQGAMIFLSTMIVILFAIMIKYRLNGPSSEDVAKMTAQALIDHDVDTLLQLTLPEERNTLNLKHDNVQAFLNDTIYTQPLPHRLIPILGTNLPVDQQGYYLASEGPCPATYKRIFVAATETRDGRWHLALGYLLSCLSATGMTDDGAESFSSIWVAMAKKHSIRGTRMNTSGYSIIRGI